MERKRLAYWTAAIAALLLLVMIGFPVMLVKNQVNQANDAAYDVSAKSGEELPDEKLAQESAFIVPVYLTKERRIEDVPLELYVRGVLAAEMPADFAAEALKAQAIAARTYVVRRAMEHDTSNVPAAGAIVTDLATHQAYISVSDMQKLWGSDKFAANLQKLNQAVHATEGMILTYDNQPIVAAFFSTSNGFTENSEEYWPQYVPYLRSVASPWDKEISPKYKTVVTIPIADFRHKLGLSEHAEDNTVPQIKVLQKTAGQRIKTIQISGKTFTGREVREKLGLKSAQFAWKFADGQIEITTYGYGHGIGLSQWGADALAKQGSTAKDILLYYYTGVSLQRISKPITL